MIKAGIKEPGFTNAAHHIIAGADKRAVELRVILQKYGIDINDAVNGVFLPTEKGASEAAYHRSLHTNLYYENVQDLMNGVSSKEEVIEVLDDIRQQLLDGTFPH